MPLGIQKQYEKVWEAIVKHFPNKPFSSREIENITLIDVNTVSFYLRKLKEEGKLKRCKKLGGKYRYQLSTNNAL